MEGPGLIHGGAYFWNIKVLCPYYNMNCTPLGPKYYQYFLPALITLYVRNSIIMRMLLLAVLVQQNKMTWLEMCGDFKQVFPYFKPSLNTSVYFRAFVCTR